MGGGVSAQVRELLKSDAERAWEARKKRAEVIEKFVMNDGDMALMERMMSDGSITNIDEYNRNYDPEETALMYQASRGDNHCHSSEHGCDDGLRPDWVHFGHRTGS